MKTQEEVAELKRQWLADPCWDIENTEGFESHQEGLLAFRQVQEATWAQDREKRLLATAGRLGVPGNVALAAYVLSLEQRLDALEAKLLLA